MGRSSENRTDERLSASQGLHLCRLQEAGSLPRSYRAVALATFVVLVGATLPTPLYQVYGEAFHFSNFTLTLIFGVYALGVIPALFVFGPLGDALCRRRVLMTAILIEALGILFLCAARGLFWLLVGRWLVGIAIGASQGNLSAALVEMQPRGDRLRAGIVTAACTLSGAAAGPLLSGLLAEYLPEPLMLCYLVELGLLTLALVRIAAIQEAASPGSLSSLRLHRPRVPRDILAGFASAGFSGGLTLSIGGLFVALVPSYVSGLLQVRNIAAGGALVALMLGMSVVGQLIMRSQSAFRLQVFGLGGGIAGLAAVVWAWPLTSLPLMFIGSIICGVSTGITYLGSISEINRLALPEERGSINSLYFVIIYLFFSLPIIGLGLAAVAIGLFPAVRIFSAIVAALSLAEILWLIIRQRSERIPK